MSDLRVVVPNDEDFIIQTSTNIPIQVSGIDSLIQIVTKTILTTPGRDVFAPSYGGGLRAVLSSTTGVTELDGAKADIGIVVMKTMSDIQEAQDTGIDVISAGGRLNSLTLERVDFDAQTGTWEIDIGVLSEAGESATVALEI